MFLTVLSPVQACSACPTRHCTASCSLLPCMHRTQLCKPGSLVCDGAVTGRFVELKDAGLEGDLVTYNTLPQGVHALGQPTVRPRHYDLDP